MLRPARKKPCNQCPFRRASLAGFLGEDSPENFMKTTMRDEPMPCHTSVDYEDPAWRSKWEAGTAGKLCAGAATFFANICKRSRDPERPVLKPDKATVFASPVEFIQHHESLGLHNSEVLPMKTQKQDVAKTYGETKPKAVCRCKHTGDGAHSQHAGPIGHGPCLVPGCKECERFTWSGWTPEFQKTLDQTNN